MSDLSIASLMIFSACIGRMGMTPRRTLPPSVILMKLPESLEKKNVHELLLSCSRPHRQEIHPDGYGTV